MRHPLRLLLLPLVGLLLAAQGAPPPADPPEDLLALSRAAAACARADGSLPAPDGDSTLTIIDYRLPSTDKRLWVIDESTGAVLFHEPVAHGRNTGENEAEAFSDVPGSLQSSLGLYRTAETYTGKHGHSLRLDGLEPGFNGNARDRAIVVHGADYVSDSFVAQVGRLGRSWGCPALRREVSAEVIDRIQGGDPLFAYADDAAWLGSSELLACARERLRPDGEARDGAFTR